MDIEQIQKKLENEVKNCHKRRQRFSFEPKVHRLYDKERKYKIWLHQKACQWQAGK